jgi:hypothetical protein
MTLYISFVLIASIGDKHVRLISKYWKHKELKSGGAIHQKKKGINRIAKIS